MNLNKVMNFISENNIQPDAVFALVEKVRYMDLNDEASIRQVIKDVSKSLDDELVEAFELEMYLKRYEKKMLKRFKKIYNFSRFNFK